MSYGSGYHGLSHQNYDRVPVTNVTGNTMRRASAPKPQNGYYNGWYVTIVSGPSKGQRRRVTGYVATPAELTIEEPFSISPVAGTVGELKSPFHTWKDDMNSDPRIRTVYQNYLDRWYEHGQTRIAEGRSPVGIFMHYTALGGFSRHGAFGARTDQETVCNADS